MLSTTENPEIVVDGIHTRINEIHADLDRIGTTVGMNKQRVSLRQELDNLLDSLCEMRDAGHSIAKPASEEDSVA